MSINSILPRHFRFPVSYVATICIFLSLYDLTRIDSFQSSYKVLKHRSLHSLPMSSEVELSELELLQRSLYQKEFDNLRHKSTWLDSIKQLPFDCTGCGNCCKTTGNVYMSPEEVIAAASYKNMTTEHFIDQYADFKLETTETKAASAISAGGGDVPWILLKNRAPENGEGPAACVFLDRETNQCGIYSVRPIQCSTYPFWSNILESEQNWNDEVRRKDNVDGEDEVHNADLPAWTPEGGGCEGMKILNGMETEADGDDAAGVPVDTALEQLSLYKRADRRLPRSYNKISLRND